jgi:hypothetical protein
MQLAQLITFGLTHLLLGYKCKPVLESADGNVYKNKKERHMGLLKG